MRVSKTLILTVIFMCFFTLATCAEYKLVWSDEFDGPGINPANWEHMLGDGTLYGIPAGWGNDEIQYYTNLPGNSFVENGNLVIQALKEYEGHQYTSARLSTAHKQDFLYGKIEARIKLPSGKGIWPAFWMLPTNSPYGAWPASGEIDIAESTNEAKYVAGIIHYGGGTQGHASSGARYSKDGVNFADDFHIYTFEWQPYEMRWYVDGNLFTTENNWWAFMRGIANEIPCPAPFDYPFYLLLNIAVAGRLTRTAPEDITSQPARMYVDWIRVYQTDNKPPELEVISPAPEANIPQDEPVVIKVQASDLDGQIDRVEFYDGEKKLGQVFKPPYYFTWGTKDGCYTVSARAIDNEDFARTKTVKFTKGRGCPPTPPPTPFHITPLRIPGRLEVEDFDRGLPGKAYYDTDKVNHGGKYRMDTGVDIGDCTEGGYALGWTIAGEWLNYTVKVAKTLQYDITFRVSSLEGAGKLHLEFDGVDKTGILSIPKTGDWQKYTDLIARNIELTAGKHIIRLVIDEGEFNLNYFEVIPVMKTISGNTNK